jgi:hypothetical protein
MNKLTLSAHRVLRCLNALERDIQHVWGQDSSITQLLPAVARPTHGLLLVACEDLGAALQEEGVMPNREDLAALVEVYDQWVTKELSDGAVGMREDLERLNRLRGMLK